MHARTIALLLLAAVFLGTGSTLVLRHVKPLVPSSALYAAYTENEDFKDNARVYKPFLRSNIYYLHLPEARPEHRWWVINFTTATVLLPNPPQHLFFLHYVHRRQPRGVSIAEEPVNADWSWQFTADGVSFSGKGFVCSVKRLGN